MGSEWSMEVDLRSEEMEKRTLYWFVNGKQQEGFIKGVPDRVAFGVFFSFSFHFTSICLITPIYLFRCAHIIRMIVFSLCI